MARMMSLTPGQRPPHVTMAAVTFGGSKNIFSRGPAVSKLRGISPRLNACCEVGSMSSYRTRWLSLLNRSECPWRNGDKYCGSPNDSIDHCIADAYKKQLVP